MYSYKHAMRVADQIRASSGPSLHDIVQQHADRLSGPANGEMYRAAMVYAGMKFDREHFGCLAISKQLTAQMAAKMLLRLAHLANKEIEVAFALYVEGLCGAALKPVLAELPEALRLQLDWWGYLMSSEENVRSVVAWMAELEAQSVPLAERRQHLLHLQEEASQVLRGSSIVDFGAFLERYTLASTSRQAS